MNLDEQKDVLKAFNLEPELVHRMESIASRRGIRFNDVIREAVQNFVEKDMVNPKGPEDDTIIQFPRPGKDLIGKEADLPRYERRVLPDPDSCPDDKLGEWLEAVRSDIKQLSTARQRDNDTGDVDGEYQVQKLLNQYREVERRLAKRHAALSPD